MKKDTLIDILQANRAHIKSFGISLLGVFGSFARNEQTDTSDVDVIVGGQVVRLWWSL